MCIELNILNLIINIINREKTLINVYNVIFLNFEHMLYI